MSKCKHQQSHYDFLYTVSKKISYWVSLFYRSNLITKVCFSWDLNFLLLHISFLHCMDLQPYSHGRFSKVSRTFFANRYWWNTRCVWAGGTFFLLSHCVSFFVVVGNSFRWYLPTIPDVPLCLVAQVSFLVVAEKNFRCYLLTNHTSCANMSVFWFRREIVFGCTVSKKDLFGFFKRERIH